MSNARASAYRAVLPFVRPFTISLTACAVIPISRAINAYVRPFERMIRLIRLLESTVSFTVNCPRFFRCLYTLNDQEIRVKLP